MPEVPALVHPPDPVLAARAAGVAHIPIVWLVFLLFRLVGVAVRAYSN